MTTDERVLARELMQFALYPDQIAMMIVVCRITGTEPFDMLNQFTKTREEVKGIVSELHSAWFRSKEREDPSSR